MQTKCLVNESLPCARTGKDKYLRTITLKSGDLKKNLWD